MSLDSASPARETIAAETLAALQASRAILEHDHFVYISGNHGSGWIDADAIFPHTELHARLCGYLATIAAQPSIDVVCGPVTGGLIVAHGVARELKALAIFAEHDRVLGPTQGPFVLRRGFGELVKERRVLIVDDIVNTGHSVRQTIAAVRAARGNVVGAAAFVNRGSITAEQLGVPRYDFLLQYDIPCWPAAGCKLCRAGIPVNTRFAHGQEFAARQRAPDE